MMRSPWQDEVAAARQARSDPAIEAVIWGALVFNWVLAFVNANIVGISQTLVVLCELALLGMALLLMLRAGLKRDQFYLLCFMALYVAFTLLRFMYGQQLEPKPLRDMAVVFVFLCLGFAYARAPYALLFRVTAVLLAIGIVEIMFADTYVRLFNIKSYYINTRGFTEADFWNTNSDLFVSGTRPGARFFLSFTNLPRASSVFLEPVSLGNFIVISLAGLLAGWRVLAGRTRAIWTAMLLGLLVISDSRYGFACGLILIGFRASLHRFPQQLGFVLFLCVIAAAAVLVEVSGISRGTDDFLGRLFYTFHALQTLDLEMLLGLRYELATRFMDSGLAYFIVSQSLLMVIALVLYYSLGIVATTPEARIYKNLILIAWSLNLLISNSLFSIKVAALMWFMLGALINGGNRAVERSEPRYPPVYAAVEK